MVAGEVDDLADGVALLAGGEAVLDEVFGAGMASPGDDPVAVDGLVEGEGVVEAEVAV